LIFHEFAIEPAAVATSWEQFRYVTEKFGFHTGRLISRFPNQWDREVIKAMQSCREIRPIEKLRIVEKLNKFKNTKLVQSQRNYEEGNTWLEKAETRHQTAPFHAVIACTNPRNRDFVTCVDELDEDEAPLRTKRGDEVERTAKALAASVKMLLESSNEIVFVDPHFNPAKQRWRSALKEFLRVAISRGRSLKRCEYHLNDDLDKNYFDQKCQELLPQCIPSEMAVEFVQWSKTACGDHLHPRFILTELTGVSIDWGLDEWPHSKTIVSILDRDLYSQLWKDYQKTTPRFTPFNSMTIIGSASRQ
jgi:hypothetical protein